MCRFHFSRKSWRKPVNQSSPKIKGTFKEIKLIPLRQIVVCYTQMLMPGQETGCHCFRTILGTVRPIPRTIRPSCNWCGGKKTAFICKSCFLKDIKGLSYFRRWVNHVDFVAILRYSSCWLPSLGLFFPRWLYQSNWLPAPALFPMSITPLLNLLANTAEWQEEIFWFSIAQRPASVTSSLMQIHQRHHKTILNADACTLICVLVSQHKYFYMGEWVTSRRSLVYFRPWPLK